MSSFVRAPQDVTGHAMGVTRGKRLLAGAEGTTQGLFGQILRRIERLAWHPP